MHNKFSYVCVHAVHFINYFLTYLFPSVLAWGNHPIITKFASWRFLKIIIWTFTKLLLQAYVLAIVVRSMMFYFSSPLNTDEDIQNLYYRGILSNPEKFTFLQATFIFPILIMCIQYLPSIVCILFLKIIDLFRPTRATVVEHSVLFVLPIFTNLCFTKSSKPPKHANKPLNKIAANKTTMQRARSIPNMDNYHLAEGKPRSKSVPNITFANNIIRLNQPNFCQFESNIIYMIFVISTSLLYGFDIFVAIARYGEIPFLTKISLVVCVINVLLWLDLNLAIWKETQAHKAR